MSTKLVKNNFLTFTYHVEIMSFQLEQKSVFCQDPLDIRQALEGILSTKNWILERLPEDKPLIIIFAEYHDKPSNIALQQAFIEQASEQSSIAVGFERPPSELKKAIARERLTRKFEDTFPSIYNNDFLTTGNRNDRLSQRLAKAHIYAPISTGALLNMCFEKKLPISFNDLEKTKRFLVPSNGSYFLSTFSRKNHYLMNMNSMSIKEKFFTTTRSPIGMSLRNQAIAYNAINHLQQTEAKVYIQRIGMAHIDNSNAANITKQFQNSGYPTLTVCLDNDFSSREIPKPRTNSMVVRGLSDNAFGSGVYNPRITMAELKHWVNINRKSGLILQL